MAVAQGGAVCLCACVKSSCFVSLVCGCFVCVCVRVWCVACVCLSHLVGVDGLPVAGEAEALEPQGGPRGCDSSARVNTPHWTLGMRLRPHNSKDARCDALADVRCSGGGSAIRRHCLARGCRCHAAMMPGGGVGRAYEDLKCAACALVGRGGGGGRMVVTVAVVVVQSTHGLAGGHMPDRFLPPGMGRSVSSNAKPISS